MRRQIHAVGRRKEDMIGNRDRAALRASETRDRFEQRRLAGPRRPDERYRPGVDPGPDVQREGTLNEVDVKHQHRQRAAPASRFEIATATKARLIDTAATAAACESRPVSVYE